MRRSPTLCAIGNFDGVHRGHLAVLARAERDALALGLTPIALTFNPPPAVVLGRESPAALTPLDRKIELIEAALPGLKVVVKSFGEDLARASPAEFARAVLADELSAARVVVGQNFRFGRGRAGDLAALEELGRELGFSAFAADLSGDERGTWSSTRIRASIAAGDWDDVARALGRPHALSGLVVRGDQRGRALGFPTANLEQVTEVLPPLGVYAVRVDRLDRGEGEPRALGLGVANVGVRPTVGAGPSVEAHLIDFPSPGVDPDLYGARLRLHLVSFLRPERRFGDLGELARQIRADKAEAERRLGPRERPRGPLGGWY